MTYRIDPPLAVVWGGSDLNEKVGQKYLTIYIRKQGGLCTGISQNVTDLLQNDIAATLISNSEFIVLLKETSVAGYVAVKDLTKGGDIIRGVTYSPFMPLVAVALIYLVLVVFFNHLVGKLERRLRSSER